MSSLIIQQVANRILTLKINRPDRKNALNHEMYDALADALEDAEGNADISVILFTGVGDIFTSGNDLVDFVNPLPEGLPPVLRFLNALREAEKPVIAAVNGTAVGVGLTLLLHCDIIMAADNATFSAPFAKVGVVPEAGSSLLLPRTVGLAWANDIMLAGRTLNAVEALQCGLISRLHSLDELMYEAVALAEQMAQIAPNALKQSKRLIRSTTHFGVKEQMKKESVIFAQQLRSPEFAESVRAFLQR